MELTIKLKQHPFLDQIPQLQVWNASPIFKLTKEKALFWLRKHFFIKNTAFNLFSNELIFDVKFIFKNHSFIFLKDINIVEDS